MAREAMDVCLRMLKESNKSRFDSYSVKESALIIAHITFPDCRVHSFSDNLSRNSCIQFYNKYCHTCAGKWFINTLNQWLAFSKRMKPKGPLIFIGLPAASRASSGAQYYRQAP